MKYLQQIMLSDKICLGKIKQMKLKTKLLLPLKEINSNETTSLEKKWALRSAY